MNSPQSVKFGGKSRAEKEESFGISDEWTGVEMLRETRMRTRGLMYFHELLHCNSLLDSPLSEPARQDCSSSQLHCGSTEYQMKNSLDRDKTNLSVWMPYFQSESCFNLSIC